MRYVRRDAVTPPPEWIGAAAAEVDEAGAYYSTGTVIRPFKFLPTRPILPTLRDLFAGKCAFCESDVAAVGSMTVSRFRPAATVVGHDGKIVTPGYWWLASDWTNLYLSCQICDRNKGARFPLVGTRARKPGDESAEAPILLDPCRDSPDDFLVCRLDGFIAGRSADPGATKSRADPAMDRGQTTIDVFGLNRSSLVESRKKEVSTLRSLVKRATGARKGSKSEAQAALQSVISHSADEAFTQFKLQVLHQLLREAGRTDLEAQLFGARTDEVEDTRSKAAPDEAERKEAFDRLDRHQTNIQSSSIEAAGDKLVFSHSALISRVEIENVRIVEDLTFDIPPGTADQTGWKVMLGENGAGKSTVLQAIALTLMGGERAKQSKDAPRKRLLRDGSRSGRVRIYLSADSAPLEIEVTPAGPVFPTGASHPRSIVLAFGAARWMPRRGSLQAERDPTIRVANLFNPYIPLNDAPTWLLGLGERQFRQVEPAILRLLDRPDGDRLRRLGGRVVIHPMGEPRSRVIPIEDLSDGYQTMLAVAGEIAAIASTWWEGLAAAEAIILLDEIGAHLHPRWKMRVVNSLRAAFPRMQFIASTHDPLCLRGLKDFEILVLRLDDQRRVVPLDHLPGVQNLRIDQLLTSPLFGLGSTLDPDTERLFNEYYSLLAKVTRNDIEGQRLEVLRATVGQQGPLGSSRRDQAIYEILDDYLATHPIEPASVVGLVDDETKRRIGRLMAGNAEARA